MLSLAFQALKGMAIMAADFKVLVIGRGMMGAAAARHLALQSDGVAVLGPDEPAERQGHRGVFASHYDEGRITRTIDKDADWARLANRSIARYGEIAEQSGIDFYTPAGCLIAGQKRSSGGTYIANVVEAAAALGVGINILDDAALAERFPFFAFAAGSEGVHEARNAGHISPRRLVKAQSLLAEKAGAAVIREAAVSTHDRGDHVEVVTDTGRSYSAEKVLVAAGGFSIAERLLPDRLAMTVYGRTIVFFEVDEAEAMRLAAMPSLISEPADPRDGIYMLPPIRYPDGRIYAKIGGDPDNLQLHTEPDIRDWFRTDGRAFARDHLVRIMGEIIPDLAVRSISTASCVTSFPPSGYPAIGFTSSPRIAVLTGGCGASAKSSDEIGRLGAELMLGNRISDGAYATDFKPEFL